MDWQMRDRLARLRDWVSKIPYFVNAFWSFCFVIILIIAWRMLVVADISIVSFQSITPSTLWTAYLQVLALAAVFAFFANLMNAVGRERPSDVYLGVNQLAQFVERKWWLRAMNTSAFKLIILLLFFLPILALVAVKVEPNHSRFIHTLGSIPGVSFTSMASLWTMCMLAVLLLLAGMFVSSVRVFMGLLDLKEGYNWKWPISQRLSRSFTRWTRRDLRFTRMRTSLARAFDFRDLRFLTELADLAQRVTTPDQQGTLLDIAVQAQTSVMGEFVQTIPKPNNNSSTSTGKLELFIDKIQRTYNPPSDSLLTVRRLLGYKWSQSGLMQTPGIPWETLASIACQDISLLDRTLYYVGDLNFETCSKDFEQNGIRLWANDLKVDFPTIQDEIVTRVADRLKTSEPDEIAERLSWLKENTYLDVEYRPGRRMVRDIVVAAGLG